MKNILILLAFVSSLAFGQSYPSPTYNNLTANGTVSGVGFSNYLASPPAIGSVTPGAGTFTQITSSGGVATSYASDTGSPAAGVRYYLDNLWNPPGNLSQLNNFLQIHMPSDSLNGGTVQQRWFSSNQLILVDVQTTGPTGTPSSPSGMADSHTIGVESVETIPAGLCDGMNGSGFTGPGGSPGNNCYQEIGGLASVNTILSPGHYAEGIASNINDNNGGAGVPIRANGMLSNISKNSATNTYTTYGYNANSIGTQQTTNAPTAAYHVDGGWQTSLDLSANTNASAVAIALPGGNSITTTAGNVLFNGNVGAVGLFASGTTDSTSPSTGAITTSGGLGVAKTITAGTQINTPGLFASGTTQSTSTTTGSLVTSGGLGVALNANIGGNLAVTGTVTPTGGTIASTSGTQPAAGQVGNVQTHSTTNTSLTAGTAANADSLSLPAGNWLVQCAMQFTGAATTSSTAYWNSVSLTSATLGGSFTNTSFLQTPAVTQAIEQFSSPFVPFSFSTPTTVYCVAESSFSTSTMSVNGAIMALRRN